jgi:hypothetical protein
MPLRRTAVVFLILWVPLALWQCLRTATTCHDGSGWSTVLWTVQFASLALPLFAAHRLGRPAAHDTRHLDDVSATLILLAYVPVTLALRLAEQCAQK